MIHVVYGNPETQDILLKNQWSSIKNLDFITTSETKPNKHLILYCSIENLEYEGMYSGISSEDFPPLEEHCNKFSSIQTNESLFTSKEEQKRIASEIEKALNKTISLPKSVSDKNVPIPQKIDLSDVKNNNKNNNEHNKKILGNHTEKVVSSKKADALDVFKNLVGETYKKNVTSVKYNQEDKEFSVCLGKSNTKGKGTLYAHYDEQQTNELFKQSKKHKDYM